MSITVDIRANVPHWRFQRAGITFLYALDEWLRKHRGGSCAGIATETSLIAAVRCVDSRHIQVAIDEFVESVNSDLPELLIAVETTVESSESEMPKRQPQ